ncbi:hypothetical protein IQ06DRAFT_308922 [Phaeosphaeriaceae sp. SRC1lsM3a]|nr:hypothetical protein IQ06DRAFT_308922 [Stagonospora sp. SRC1lsM3a]
MRLISAVFAAATLFAATVLCNDDDWPHPRRTMNTPCTEQLEGHQLCRLHRRSDDAGLTAASLIMECKNGKWRQVEGCELWKPCIEQQPPGKPYCWNEFNYLRDECPTEEKGWWCVTWEN